MPAVPNFQRSRLMKPIKGHPSAHLFEADDALNTAFKLRACIRLLARHFFASIFIGVKFGDLRRDPIPTLNFLHQARQVIQWPWDGNQPIYPVPKLCGSG